MANLSELLVGDKRTALTAELAEYARTTVNNQSGITGMALKGGLAAATKAKPDIVEVVLNKVLPDILDILSPYWESKPEGTAFGAHLEANKDDVAAKFIDLADRQTEAAGNNPLVKVYSSLRGKATKIIAENIAGLGDIIEANL